MDQDEIDDIKFEVATCYMMAVSYFDREEHLKARIYARSVLRQLDLLPPGNEDFVALYWQRCNDLN